MINKPISPTNLNKQIRALTDTLGWDIWATYSDKRAKGKRVKFMRNGWMPPQKVQDKIKLKVEKLLASYGLQDTHKISWRMGESWRGEYLYLSMQVKNK